MAESGPAAKQGKFSVTISRQMGSLGGEVARLVAELLGYRFFWREVINQAARQSGAPEAALATIDELDLLSMRPSPAERQAYRQAVEEIMEQIAEEGNAVILGRAGQMNLQGRPAVMHVRVIARLEVRIERVAARQKIPARCAREQIKASDRSRRNYLKQFYNVRWDDPELYDLVINTESFSAPAAAQIIAQALFLRSSSMHAPSHLESTLEQ